MPAPRKLEDSIIWHREQIARLNDAIARGEPGTAVAKGAVWGPKTRSDVLPTTMLGMRRELEHYEQALQGLEEQRGQGG
ncbi:MAG TPA: hypothetical protein VMT98_17510 [Verrucomicrobiae bacterium]|nr:hypothetical protein [Verrucomicrobiae bacterium]